MTVNASSLTRISVDTSETSANNIATGGVMSADGRYVVFQSTATNLVGGDVNGFFDVFLRDTVTGTTSSAAAIAAISRSRRRPVGRRASRRVAPTADPPLVPPVRSTPGCGTR